MSTCGRLRLQAQSVLSSALAHTARYLMTAVQCYLQITVTTLT